MSTFKDAITTARLAPGTTESDVREAEVYTLGIITAEPRADLCEVVIAAISAWDSLHEKTTAAKVGCAKAVDTYLRLIVEQQPDGSFKARGPKA